MGVEALYPRREGTFEEGSVIVMAAKVLKLGAIGFLLGMVVGVLILVSIGFAHGGSLVLPPTLLAMTGSEAGALLAHMLLSGVFGFVPWAGVVFYEIDSWGLLKQAVVHYASYTVAFMVVGFVAGWVETPADMALMAGIFLVGHGIIWTIMYLRFKAATEELNTLLQKTRRDA